MFRVTVACDGIGPDAWPEALDDVRKEFSTRTWHQIVDVRWDDATLLLVAVNDYDDTGDALADEFSDTVAAYAPGTPGYRITIVMAERLKTFP
jgi:hypothetical protein